MALDRIAMQRGLGVFLVLMGSYAYFWHSRDWNTASRLMLTYSLVDRGTLSIDGLNQQTGDLALFQGRYYCDKLPGYPYLATIPYAALKFLGGARAHPLNGPALAYWPSDYGVTLATSGLLTAATALVLMGLACDLGCSQRAATFIALTYGISTPAYVYATLAYGHQTTAFLLLSSFALLTKTGTEREGPRMAWAGVLASFAAVVELQVGPVSAVLGLYLLSQWGMGLRRWPSVAAFGLGALIPALGMLLYNLMAFGNPFDMGYFHHATAPFAAVHSKENPLGLRALDWGRAVPLLWGRHRGLLFYAPILALAVPGWLWLFAGKRRTLGLVSLAACLAVFAVNLSYPEWTGGWSTGPRLLVPLLPFAMLAVAATLTTPSRLRGAFWMAAIPLSLTGAGLMLLFQGVGARLPQDLVDPLVQAVWPLWRGDAIPPWWIGERFTQNLFGIAFGRIGGDPSAGWGALAFAPLVLFQTVGVVWLMSRPEPKPQPEADAQL